MNPAFSVVLFTVLAGAAQGLLVALALTRFAGVVVTPGFIDLTLLTAEALLAAGLIASFTHLGRPARAWRAVLMWRTSWLSREVTLLPALMAAVAAWWLAQRAGADPLLPMLATLALAAALWYCTAMIYACLRFIAEWAQPLTLVNFTLIGLSSGAVLAAALGAWRGETRFIAAAGPWALLATLAALATRSLALHRNAARLPRSTLQSATGIRAEKLVQTSMGMSAGSFNTREFFHRATPAAFRRIKLGLIVFGFVLPAALLAVALLGDVPPAFVLAALVQAPGLIAERWTFFAEARHPQNLYYQAVS